MTFTGVREEYYETGELKSTWFECNGIRDGEYREFYEKNAKDNWNIYDEKK